MKRISTLLLSAAMMFGAVGASDAAELKASGVFDFSFGASRTNPEKKGGNPGNNEEYFRAVQRFRPQLNFVASEKLQAVMQLEIGRTHFGREDGGRIDQRAANVKVKRLYLDWVIPTTEINVRMGIQPFALPSATGFGNPVFNSDATGIVVSGQVNEMVGLTGFWIRPFDEGQNNNNVSDEVDTFGLVMPVKAEGWSVSPWLMFANIGNAADGYWDYLAGENLAAANPMGLQRGENTAAYWLGLGGDYQITDKLKFAADFIYGGTSDFETEAVGDDFDISGYWMDASLSYDIDNIGTATLLGWYASGNDAEDGDIEQMPVVGLNIQNTFTSFGFPGGMGLAQDGAFMGTALGTWGLGAKLSDVSFVQDLSHTFAVTYYQGTNNRESINHFQVNGRDTYLTHHDSAWEFNFDSKYQIYENLATILELGYINIDLDRDTWGADESKTDDLWKAEVMFKYSF